MSTRSVRPSPGLANVRYEIRGKLARRAQEMERMGYDIVSLNIGNPGAFGFRTPETMRLAMIENLRAAEGYCHQKGIFPAREAVVMQQQERGVRGVTADDVFIGNGVSELIVMVTQALANTGDEILIPAPDTQLPSATPLPAGIAYGTLIQYTVVSGDTLEGIAARFNSTVEAIMAITMKPMPSVNSGMSKLNRATPEFTSVPTRPTSKPRRIMPTAFSKDPEANTTAPTRPRTMSEKYSAGPNLKATSVNGTAKAASTNVPTQPAKNEPMPAAASAGPALP